MTTTAFVSLSDVECAKCGIIFGLTPTFTRERREKHDTFYCPSGHPQHFPQRTELEIARDQVARETHRREQAEARADTLNERVEHTERRRRATVGVLTKIKKRVGCGVCPCCQRTFKQLAAHMKSKHLTFSESCVEISK